MTLVRIALISAMALLVLAGAQTLGAAASHPAAHAAKKAKCKPGVRKVGGRLSRVYCGAARATVKIGNRTLVFKNGSCTRTAKALAVNIGVLVLTRGPRASYFGLAIGRSPITPEGSPASTDGTYSDEALITFSKPKRQSYTVYKSELTLKNGRRAGSFTGGSEFDGGLPISGSFHC